MPPLFVVGLTLGSHDTTIRACWNEQNNFPVVQEPVHIFFLYCVTVSITGENQIHSSFRGVLN